MAFFICQSCPTFRVEGQRQRAFFGTAAPGFPDFFLLLGPNTDLGHNSVLLILEAQIAHVIRALYHMREHAPALAEISKADEAEFNADLRRRMVGTVWERGGCTSWYLDTKSQIPYCGQATASRSRVD
jgi:cation diffusion facilitator CzcD-associated flavoprotein CzcO